MATDARNIYKEPKFWVMLLLLSPVFFYSCIRGVGFVIAQIITFFLPKSVFRQDFVQVPAPEYQPENVKNTK
ncbi:MAG: hypothetical protein U1E88_05800 [Acinetobacter sp.]